MVRESKPYSDKSAPYATMGDSPDSYLYKKGSKQKLVGSADNDPEAGEEELAEDEGYQYRDEIDYEEDNSKIWHYGKAPGGDWEVIDRSPYAQMDNFAWDLYVDFHKEHGRWPNQNESRKIEDLEYNVMTKMNEELNEIRALAGLPPVAEDCDETPGEDKNDDGDCSPFTHADDNVDMVREEDIEEDIFDEDFLAPPKDVEHGHYEDEGEEDDWDVRDAPELDRQTNYDAPSRYDGDDSFDFDIDNDYYGEDANTKVGREFASSEFGGETGNTHVGRAFASGEIEEEGPGDEDEFDFDDDAIVDVGDDEDYEVFDFDDEFERMMGNTNRFESVVEMNELRRLAGLAPIEESEVAEETVNESLPTHGPKEWWKNDPEVLMGYIYWLQRQLPPKDKKAAWEKIVAKLNAENPAPEGEIPTLEGMMEEEGEGKTCSRCRKGKMERGETFFGPAERCNKCNFQRQLRESAPHGSDDYDMFDFEDDRAYFLVADEIGDRIIFGMNNEVGVPEQYTDEMIGLLRRHGFEKGIDYEVSFVNQSIAGKPYSHGMPVDGGEPLEDDIQNGYNDHEFADAYDDYFPRGAHQSPSDDLGPTASGFGDNAMKNKMRSKETDEVYESMRQKYRRFRLS